MHKDIRPFHTILLLSTAYVIIIITITTATTITTTTTTTIPSICSSNSTTHQHIITPVLSVLVQLPLIKYNVGINDDDNNSNNFTIIEFIPDYLIKMAEE
ncbi:hypothetical protein LOAG_16112 [Loa loa]|uniref:Uncharacterized protein n=1 Tax=Loa loa TaxID=7209 RepID=A0A1S0TE52_LOALO|nr:hypothetical protein LOAG_16112 [Loa loa]EFO12422.1 hypothetical protein LOAG_16112 [Loa loa]